MASSRDGCDGAQLFSPPLWIQRRALVSHILKNNGVQSVLDLGCGEGALLEILLNDPTFSKLAGVDIDGESLRYASVNCAPTDYDRQYLRELPVEFNLYEGSVDQLDKSLTGFDAITSVEVIEHLDPPVLAAFPAVTLGGYRPRIMVVTTPNGDFNVNFPDLKWGTPEAGFRHYDHRFEWTRDEFQRWANSAATKFGYTVSFDGVGILSSKPGDLSVGHCSQVAIFIRQRCDYDSPLSSLDDCPALSESPYKHYAKIEFPYFTESGFSSEAITQELKEKTFPLIWNEWYSMIEDAKRDQLAAKLSWPAVGTWCLPFERYWSILRIRQLCKTRGRLEEVFTSSAAKESFIWNDEERKVVILFEIPKEHESEEDGTEDADWGYGSPAYDDWDDDSAWKDTKWKASRDSDGEGWGTAHITAEWDCQAGWGEEIAIYGSAANPPPKKVRLLEDPGGNDGITI
ncbi:uncharacterized protein SPPG_04924 [Spizellomyces punctatus DAOM BR117]|uniref:Small RNA 2'-O-methyltransferase n=1 Tax=Spizellomyces punctatus (strain DAOM BR117) TaxID=645134 RepID=A0A0L0HEW9_SPIPD|nr:uncharacterized protein SPPG_04924 [Spizellomyces punctatus DAOM BR117]KNC99534.1 hypothetical protein SPPG_04924 [Spizellomyces punctatus DAOM BR117]|eukprot:XP_016607574.1 hypothetical protein SPPG_04924 [Spizellomyces punctatus DAOM BR117]